MNQNIHFPTHSGTVVKMAIFTFREVRNYLREVIPLTRSGVVTSKMTEVDAGDTV